jgi:O-antigen ligase
LQHLLEQGIIGLVLWATFYSIIFFYFWKNRTKRKALTGLGASILILYLVFSIGTGELGSVYPTMLLLGMTMKMIESKKRRLMLYAVLQRIMKRKKLTRRQQLIVMLKAISR